MESPCSPRRDDSRNRKRETHRPRGTTSPSHAFRYRLLEMPVEDFTRATRPAPSPESGAGQRVRGISWTRGARFQVGLEMREESPSSCPPVVRSGSRRDCDSTADRRSGIGGPAMGARRSERVSQRRRPRETGRRLLSSVSRGDGRRRMLGCRFRRSVVPAQLCPDKLNFRQLLRNCVCKRYRDNKTAAGGAAPLHEGHLRARKAMAAEDQPRADQLRNGLALDPWDLFPECEPGRVARRRGSWRWPSSARPSPAVLSRRAIRSISS